MLQAGAQAVVAAQWAVDDQATYLLMVRFIQKWLPQMEHEPPAAALIGTRTSLVMPRDQPEARPLAKHLANATQTASNNTFVGTKPDTLLATSSCSGTIGTLEKR